MGDVVLALDKITVKVGLCDGCRGNIDERIAAGQKKIWEELPSIFDLPPWNELKNDL